MGDWSGLYGCVTSGLTTLDCTRPPRELVDFEAMQKRLEDLKRAGARGLMVLPVERMLA